MQEIDMRSARAAFFRPEPGPHGCSAVSKNKNFSPGPARKRISDPARTIFLSDFGLNCLSLSDFKTDSLNQLHKINIFFANDLFFCNLINQPIDWFPQFLIKITSYYINTKNKIQNWTLIQNYLPSKYKHSKSITKGMSKSEL